MKIESPVLDVLKRCRVDGLSLVITAQLDRALYVKTNKAIEMLGGKWDKKAKAHIFDADPLDAITDAVATGEVVDAKKKFQFYETPDLVADRMAAFINPQAGEDILEPSAGRGALIRAIKRRQSNVNISAFELNEKNWAHLNGHCVIMGQNFLELKPLDFLKFDAIIANPPFRNGQDIQHVQHMFRFLKSGGRMAVVTGPGWTFRNDRKHTEFREWLLTLDHAVEELPAGTFKTSGTEVRATLVTITTHDNRNTPQPD